jgi:hypothetical protein
MDVPVKGYSHVGENADQPAYVTRQGGDTIADAVPISLGDVVNGTTIGYTNDYDEVCPYSGSTSPDVVYSLVVAADAAVNLDLCDADGTQYDTKIYVYENAVGNLIACNDDFCATNWTNYASRLENVPMFPGNTYYIVVDGYGGDAGNYQLWLEEAPPPQIPECTDYHVPEGEPALVDGYVDNYNGGCNSAPAVFQVINWIDIETECAHLCGVSGWYNMPLGMYRDTDWFEVTAAGFQMDIEFNTEHFFQILISAPNPTCATVAWDIVDTFNPNTPSAYAVPTNPGDVYWIWAGPGEWIDLPDFIYTLEVCGAQYDVVPTESASWGEMKSMYK